MRTPDFTIVMPSCNQAQFLETSLRSILKHDGVALEVLVFDACSSDGSVDILRHLERDPRLRWSSVSDHGQAHAINKGMRAARGRILAYLNSDDVYFPGALTEVARVFEQDPKALFVYGRAHHLNEDGSFMEEYPTEPWNFQQLQWRCYLCQPAVFWRREVLDRFGYLDDTLEYAMDYEFWLRAGAHTAFRYVEDVVLAGSRLHKGTKTMSERMRVHRECLDVVKRHATSDAPVLQWLRHAAHHKAEALGRSVPDGGVLLPHGLLLARQLLELSVETGVLPDLALQQEIDRILEDVSVKYDANDT